MSALIHKYFEIAIPVDKDNNKYKCKVCALLNERNKDDSVIFIKTHGNTTSNLIKHLTKASHSVQYEEYQRLVGDGTPQQQAAKRKRLDFEKKTADPSSPQTPVSDKSKLGIFFNNVSITRKYDSKSILQKARYLRVSIFFNFNNKYLNFLNIL